jgi:diguanylate cyclase (GGDEF)-like protein
MTQARLRHVTGDGTPDADLKRAADSRRNDADRNLVRKFGVLSAVPIILLGVVLGQTQANGIRSRAVDNARQSTSVLARLAIEPQVSAADLSQGLSPDRVTALDGIFHRSGVLGGEVARIKIWNRDLKVVYSDDHSAIGRTFPSSVELVDAFGGRVASELADLSKSENQGDRQYGHLLEVYVPLRVGSGSQPEGVFEIYLPYGPIDAAITHATEQLYGLLVAGLVLLYLVLFRIVVSASRRLRRQATANEYLALHDPLTGLPNRVLFHDRVDQIILAAKREGSGAAVIVLDLDRFKEVNDTLGHPIGDLLLQQVAARIRGATREADSVARLGGDEFALVLSTASDPNAVAGVAERIQSALNTPFNLEGMSIEVEASLGAARYPEDGGDADTLLRRADVAMYVAKENKSGFEVYASETDSYSPDRLVLLAELRHAIATDELVLHYQPVIDLGSGRVVAVEALVRWIHPTRGLIGPDDFIPLAESSEQIGPLTTWVLNHALEQSRRWQDTGVDLLMAVNLSARNLHHPGFPAEVGGLLARWGVAPRSLELEITESAVMADPTRAIKILGELQGLGVSLAIDDFGTGYSSLSYLSRLPVAKIKIDRSFVISMDTNDNDAVIVRSTIELGRSLGLDVIAEGVETKQVGRELERLGCDLAQGYLWSPAMPADQLSAWLEARTEHHEPDHALLGSRSRGSLMVREASMEVYT